MVLLQECLGQGKRRVILHHFYLGGNNPRRRWLCDHNTASMLSLLCKGATQGQGCASVA